MTIQVTLINSCKTTIIVAITYNLRNFQEFATKSKRTVKMGLETLNYRSPQLWSILPENLRKINSLGKFKENHRK